MFAEIEHASLAAPLLAYLVARALAMPFARRFPGSAPATLAVLGAGASAALAALGQTAWSPASPYWMAADIACALALFAVGSEAGKARRRPREETPQGSRRLRRSVAFLIPLSVGFMLAAGFGAANGAGAIPVVKTALVLAAALWLSSDTSGSGLLAAGLALVAASDTSLVAPEAAIVSLGIVAAMGASGGITRTGGGQGRSIRGIVPALALALAWALRSTGLPWPVAGLTAGFAFGLERRLADSSITGVMPPRSSGSLARRATAEVAYALAFIAGFCISLERLTGEIPSILVIAGSVLASAALRTLVSGTRSPYFPAEAAAFAALLTAVRAGLASDAALAGVALAFLVAAPLSRIGMRNLASISSIPPVKAVVAVSTKGATFGSLSFAAAIGAPGEPIRVACVAASEGSAGTTPGEAEEALVRCVATGASAEIRVLPTVVISASIPDGLARAAFERRADAIVLGLRDSARSGGKKYKTALDGLLVAFPGSIIALRRAENFSTARRLVALAVAGAEESPGFLPALMAASRAWGRPVGSMEAMMIGAPASALVDAAEGLLDERTAMSVPSWRDVPQALDAQASQNASFVVFSSRPGVKAWNPGHERLPVVLDAAFPDSSIVLWFLPAPAETASADDEAERPRKTAPQEEAGTFPAARHDWPPIVAAAWSAGRIMTDMREEALVDAIRRLTDAVFPHDRGASGRLASEFSAVARKEPIELAPGVLLLHAHANGLALPTLAIGARPAGWPLVALTSPVRITVALVSPTSSGPELHLEALTQIAEAFRNLGLAENLLAEPREQPSIGRNNTIA